MTSNVVDYFATLGRKPGPFTCTSLKSIWGDGKPIDPAEIWNDAITDILLVHPDDEIDSNNWTLLSTTVDGDELPYPHIAFRRRRDTHRLDHFTKLKFIQAAVYIPTGYELIKSVWGQEVLLKPFGYLCAKRADTSSAMFIQGEDLVDDICIVLNEGEDVPDDYKSIERIGPPYDSKNNPPPHMRFYFHQRPPMGLCDLGYESVTLDRYPEKDCGGLKLPVNELPMFAFPNGLRLTFSSLNRFPLPIFFTFVFTDMDGGHLYAACLRVYEQVDVADLQPVFQQIYGDNHKLEILPGSSIFYPKVLCVLSKMPFYRAMRRFLRQIYSLSLSSLAVPLEYFVASLVNQIPLPIEGGRSFHVMLDSALISPNSRPMAPIVFEMPISRFFPMMDLDFAGPLRCLHVEHMLTVFVLMLREAKIVFVCNSNTMLTEAMETFRMLLFPLTWSSCFVSRLPDALTGMLEAPGGLMIGLQVPESSGYNSERIVNNNSDKLSKPLSSSNQFISNLHRTHPIAQGTYVVDLSDNVIYRYDGKHAAEALSPYQIESLVKTIPIGPRTRLKTKLQKIATEYHIGPQTVGLEEFDSAFDFQSQDDTHISAKKWEEFPTLEIRDAFMTLMIDILGNFPKYIIPPIEDLTADTYRTFKEEFSVQDYLEDSDVSTRTLLEYLMETQMFAVLLQERSEGSLYSIVFFEQASNLLNELGLRAGGHGIKHSSAPSTVSEMPAPLFELLEAESRWSSLSKLMQQQILNTNLLTQQQQQQHHSPLNHYHSSDATTSKVIPHQLTFVTVPSSSTSPMRSVTSSSSSSATVSRTSHPVTNEKLSILLTMHKIMKANDLSSSHTYDSNTTKLSIMRQELDRNEDLQLHIKDCGPLIIPGPMLHRNVNKSDGDNVDEEIATKHFGDDNSNNGEQQQVSREDDDKPVFLYQNGWPTFNKDLLQQAQEHINVRIKEIRTARLFVIEKVNKNIYKLIRSPSERLSFEQHNNRMHHKLKLLDSAVASQHHEELIAIISAIVDITSISITMLATRVIQLVKPTSDILQMLGIVAQMEHLGLMPMMNESTWRSILVSCSVCGGDLIRRIVCVIFECINSVKISPDALTYGQYIKALSSKKLHEKLSLHQSNSETIDQFVYLEELGYTWFIQRAALIERAQVDQDYSSLVGNSGAPSEMFNKSLAPTPTHAAGKQERFARLKRSSLGNMMGLMSESPKGFENVANRRLVVKATTGATKLISEQFTLYRSIGLLGFVRPSDMIGVCYPRNTNTFLSKQPECLENIQEEILERMEKLYADSVPVPSQTTSRLIRKRTDSMSSTTSSLAAAVSLNIFSSASKESLHATPDKHSNTSNSSAHISPMGSMMSKFGAQLFHSATKPATTTSIISPSSSSSTSQLTKAAPMFESWTKRLGASVFSNATTGKTPPPATSSSKPPLPVSSNGAATTPTKSHYDAVNHVSEKKQPPNMDESVINADLIQLKVLSEKLNFDEEDDDEDDDDARTKSERGSLVDNTAISSELDGANKDNCSDHRVNSIDNNNNSSIAVVDAVVGIAAENLPGKQQHQQNVSSEMDDNRHNSGVTNKETTLLNASSNESIDGTNKELSHTNSLDSNSNLAGQTTNSKSAPIPPPPLDIKKPPVDTVSLQKKVLEAFQTEFVERGFVIGIHSYTPCDGCGYVMLDEEVMNQWCRCESIDITNHRHYVKATNSSQNLNGSLQQQSQQLGRKEMVRNMNTLHKIVCPQCPKEFNPQLHIRCYRKNMTMFDAGSGNKNKHDDHNADRDFTLFHNETKNIETLNPLLDIIWSENINYLSPFGLRFELEEIIQRIGEQVCNADWLHEHKPELFWGIIWYTTRFHLPSGFMTLPSLSSNQHDIEEHAYYRRNRRLTLSDQQHVCDGPVVVGWRESVVQAKIYRILNNYITNAMDLIDLFPYCTEEELNIIKDKVVDCLDGSPAGMRAAMLEFIHCERILLHNKACGISSARTIYTSLLTICYLFKRHKLVEVNTAEPLKGLGKECTFDKVFVDAIKWVLSKQDIVSMCTTERELLDCVASKETQIIRNGFGFLF